MRAKVEGLGSKILDIVYVDDDADAVETAIARFTRGADSTDLVLTAGSASTDARHLLHGHRCARRSGRAAGRAGASGSMLWLARVGGTSVLGPPDVRGLLEGHGRGSLSCRGCCR